MVHIQTSTDKKLMDSKRYRQVPIMASPSSLNRERERDDILQDGHIEHAGILVDTVDDVTGKKLLRKLDYRIIPMIMWSRSLFVSTQQANTTIADSFEST